MATEAANLVPVMSSAQLEEMNALSRKNADTRQNSPFIQSLAAHAKKRWEAVRDSKYNVEKRLSQCLRQRNGEYDPDKLAAIKAQGGSEIYMNLTSVKCRGASSWLRDTLMGSGAEKPWELSSTPIPELPPDVTQRIQAELTQQVMQFMQASGGQQPPQEQVVALAEQMKDKAAVMLRDESRKRVERMEFKMEDQLIEGGFSVALSQFIDDIVTFPTAILKGPVARKRKTLKWNGTVLEPTEQIRMEWERVDPFKFYPAPWVGSVNEGYVIERHRMTRADMEALMGVEGYSEGDIRAVLSDFDGGGLREWLSVDAVQLEAEGKPTEAANDNDLIDAIQLWDEVSGKALTEWGMDSGEVADADKAYPCEIWLVGSRVIKAVLNYDPLGRKPYYATSYEKIPGAFWGNGVPDLIRDCQQMCNSAARALSNNMGIACLTADTVVYREGTGKDPKRREVTIGELWASKLLPNSGLRRNLLRALDETTGEFVAQRVQDIHFNGVRPVFRVTTEAGYTLKATSTHRFMAPDGSWRMLDSFVPGDLIAVNGATTPLASRRESIRASHPSVDLNTLLPTAVMTPEQALVDHEAHYAHMTVDGRIIKLPAVCADCGTPVNPYLHKYIDYDRIVSIESLPAESVYDLEMVAPHHNFIANGFVSHNSGPQVGVNISRLPPGENITQMYPWKVWQFQNTDYQDASKPLDFFQPPSNAAELLGVFEKFMILADEYSGIPRYMTGESAPGAGRTASGLSMLISNASKGLKQVINNIDKDCLTPMLERQYQHNLRYSEDQDLVGDVSIVAKGAMSLVAKESAAVRRNEFLQLTLNSPVVQQIIGLPGTAELLRDAAKQLDMSVDNIVPNREEIQQMLQQQQEQAMQQQQAALQPSQETIEFARGEDGAVIGATKKKFINPAMGGQGSSFSLPQPSAPKATQPDGTPQGGREGSLMVNRISGSNGFGGN